MAEVGELGKPTKPKRTWPTCFDAGVFVGLAFAAWPAHHIGATFYDIMLSLSTIFVCAFILFSSELLFRLARGG
jgi:hypothetical protein